MVILNTFSGEGNKVWEECKKLNAKDFILVAISKMSWSNDMTPFGNVHLYIKEIVIAKDMQMNI